LVYIEGENWLFRLGIIGASLSKRTQIDDILINVAEKGEQRVL